MVTALQIIHAGLFPSARPVPANAVGQIPDAGQANCGGQSTPPSQLRCATAARLLRWLPRLGEPAPAPAPAAVAPAAAAPAPDLLAPAPPPVAPGRPRCPLRLPPSCCCAAAARPPPAWPAPRPQNCGPWRWRTRKRGCRARPRPCAPPCLQGGKQSRGDEEGWRGSRTHKEGRAGSHPSLTRQLSNVPSP